MRCLGTHVGCYATAHTCFMLRNCMCPYCSYHARMVWGAGVVACIVLAHMLDATQLHIHVLFATQLLLVVVACVVLTHMLDAAQLHINVLFATQLYMLIVVACVVLTHMLDVTQLHIHVGCYATAHTCCMLRNCMCSYMIDRHSSARQSLVAFEKKCAKKPVQ